MTTIIISDIHNRVNWIEKGLTKLKEIYNYDEVVFLGDYFDNFHDSSFEAGGTAIWLKESLRYNDRVHLLGNHDMPYMVPTNDSLWCPGFTPEKAKVIRNTLTTEMWEKFKPAHFTQNYLLSHAGFNPKLVTHPVTGIPSPQDLVVLAEEGLQKVKMNFAHPLFLAGSRMSTGHIGGITWGDWEDEFMGIDGIDQIVGHTPDRKVQTYVAVGSMNYCMDTHNQHIGIIKDGELSFVLRSQTLGF